MCITVNQAGPAAEVMSASFLVGLASCFFPRSSDFTKVAVPHCSLQGKHEGLGICLEGARGGSALVALVSRSSQHYQLFHLVKLLSPPLSFSLCFYSTLTKQVFFLFLFLFFAVKPRSWGLEAFSDGHLCLSV